MKLFGKKKPGLKLEISAEYFIAAPVEASGRIETDSDILLDGKFKGYIKTGGLIEIGENAKIEATLSGRAVIIEGQIDGKITARDDVQISRCAIVSGEINSSQIEIEKGALVKSKIEVSR